jgi:hypothetical protein
MKTLIIPTPGGYRIHMADHRRRQAEALGALASKFLQAQDPRLWTRAANGDFLRMVKHGAKILRTIGLHAMLDLTETEAHLAFMACQFISLRVELLTAKERRSLQHLLLILARCCYLEVHPSVIPFAADAPPRLQVARHLATTYYELQRSNRISLADALGLCTALTNRGPEFDDLCDALRSGTEGLQETVLRVQGTWRRSNKESA